jgi:hypothetical protein
MTGMSLAACEPQVTPQAAQPAAPAATEGQASGPTAAAPAAPEASPTAGVAAAPALGHTSTPGDLPTGKGIFLGDQSTVSSLNKARAFAGDRFTLGRFERPYNANTMDVYFPYLDIVSANLFQDSTWVYARITLVGRDSNDSLPGKYAVEVDTDMDGRGDFLVLVDHPSSTSWTTDGVQVLRDTNGDVGGENIINSDSQGSGNGYETVVFNQGAGDDPDAAWARLSAGDPHSLEVAFKVSLLEGDSTYLVGIWAGNDALNPALFDLNDHYTHEQAGEANADIANYYPIKGLSELDNTCRAAMGFIPTGTEPAICSQGQ